MQVQRRKGKNMSNTDHLKDLSNRLSTIWDEVMAASDIEIDELSAHLWIFAFGDHSRLRGKHRIFT